MAKNRFYYILIAILLIAIAAVLILGISRAGKTTAPQTGAEEPGGAGSETEEPSGAGHIIQTEQTVSAELVEDALRNMGFLVTQEYDCTGVLSNSKVKSILGINLPFTESSVLFSYDATVEAGIDFTRVTVEKDDSTHEITIRLPEAEVKSVSIDTDSFTLYEEKDGLGTKLTLTDFNDSLQQFEETVTAAALEKGLLDKATANAKAVVLNVVRSILQNASYRITIQ